MVNRVDFQNISGLSQYENLVDFEGLTPEFFGPPGPEDRMNDMMLSNMLGINNSGMDRETTKANILSKLTGKSVNEMKEFFSNVSEQDMRKDMQFMRENGLEPSYQPNIMMSRAENKALIANELIAQNMERCMNAQAYNPYERLNSSKSKTAQTVDEMLDNMETDSTESTDEDTDTSDSTTDDTE